MGRRGQKEVYLLGMSIHYASARLAVRLDPETISDPINPYQLRRKADIEWHYFSIYEGE
jgi:hypothetical protein